MTPRAVGLGAFLALCVTLLMNYNDYVLNNTLLIGNHLPVAGTALLLALAVVVNGALRRIGPRRELAPGELLLVWSMIGVAGGVGGSGLMRCLPGYLAAPAYLATPANEWHVWVLPALPDWMLVGRDGADPAIIGYMEGLPRDRTIPWARWIAPLLAWTMFALPLFALMIACCAIFYRPWSDHERLIFPIAGLPHAIAAAPAKGRWLNAFLADPVVWAGAAVPLVVNGINGLQAHLPALPAVPTSWGAAGWFPDRPWSEFSLGTARLYFSMVGFTFLLTTETSFSLWASYVLFRLTYVLVAWIGAAGGGFFGQWYTRVAVFETAGAVFVVTGFLLWTARGWLRGLVRRARLGRTDAAADVLPPRLALALLAGGLAGTAGWLVSAGASWWAAVSGMLLFACVMLVLTRIVAEAGLLFVGNRSPAADFLMGLLPAGWLTASTVASLIMLKGVLMRDLKEFVMPYMMNGVRAGALTRLPLARLLLVLGLTAVGAIGVSAYARLTTGYKYGGVNGDDWANLWAPRDFLGQLASFRKRPPALEWIEAGAARLVPVNVAHLGLGAAIAGGLLWLRTRFVRWPLSPFGLIMCATYQMEMSWFSLFLGWLAKTGVMTFGGVTAYRKVLPFFLGLVLGEAVIATVWVVVSIATGEQGIYLLPD